MSRSQKRDTLFRSRNNIINVQREHEERGKGGGFDDQICGHLSPTPLVEEEKKKKETKRQSRRTSKSRTRIQRRL